MSTQIIQKFPSVIKCQIFYPDNQSRQNISMKGICSILWHPEIYFNISPPPIIIMQDIINEIAIALFEHGQLTKIANRFSPSYFASLIGLLQKCQEFNDLYLVIEITKTILLLLIIISETQKKRSMSQTQRLSCTNIDLQDQSQAYSQESPQKHNQLPFWKIIKQKLYQRVNIILLISLVIIIFGITITNHVVNNSLKIQTINSYEVVQPEQIKKIDIQQNNRSQKQEPKFNDLLKTTNNNQKDIVQMQINSFKNKNHVIKKYKQLGNQLKGLLRAIDDLKQEAMYINETRNNQIKTNQQQIQTNNVKDIAGLQQFAQPVSTLPQILWLYTQYRYQSEKMVEQMFGNFIVHKARQSNFQVRFVNAWSAYQWISNKTEAKITKAMQNRQIEVSVNELLRLALLMEHGGIILRVSQNLLVEGFDWLNNYFRSYSEVGSPKLPKQVLLFSETTQISSKPTYYDYFLAAVPNAALITDIFDSLCKVITLDQTTDNLRLPIKINLDVNSTYIPDITRNIIKSLFSYKSPQNYSTHVINVDVTIFLRQDFKDRLSHWLKRPYWEFQLECDRPVHVLHLSEEDRCNIQDEMENALANHNLGAEKQSYWHNLMTIEPNRKLYEPLPPRPIHFCIIDAHPSNDGIINSFQKLKLQEFKNLTAVYFVEKEMYENVEYANSQKSKGFNIVLPINTGSVGRNYEVGIIKNCPNKSFVVILKRSQSFSSSEDLQILANQVQPRSVLGSFLGLSLSGKVKHVKQIYNKYNKEEFNRENPKYEDLSQILNHLRVFHSDCYKIIPQFSLRTTQGFYLNDRFNFLEHFLYMVNNNTDKHDESENQHTQRVKWYIKSNSHIFDVPNRISAVRKVVLDVNKWEEVDRDELIYNRFNYSPYSMTYNMDHLVQKGIPMEEFAVFNPAHKYEPYTERNKPQLIPKVFHSIWIEGEMSEAKKKILQLNKELYPEYQFKLWTKNNITREKFPYSYDLLNTIYAMEPTSRFGKRATMADVLRHELIYNEGGIYMDTNMMLFNRVLDKMLSYKFVLPSEGTYRHRWSQNMCIFAAMPKFPGLLRLISHNNTNHYNLHSRDALDIAGPINFRWVVRGMEQYDPDYLIMKYDTFYPTGEPYCFTDYHKQDVTDEVVYVSGDKHLIKYCGKYYPTSYGKEINELGGTSWLHPKW